MSAAATKRGTHAVSGMERGTRREMRNERQGFDPARFPTKPPACYRAPWRLPGPDFHRLATTSLRNKPSTKHLINHLIPTGRTGRHRMNERTERPTPSHGLAGEGHERMPKIDTA